MEEKYDSFGNKIGKHSHKNGVKCFLYQTGLGLVRFSEVENSWERLVGTGRRLRESRIGWFILKEVSRG